MTETSPDTDFDSGPWATISSGMKIHAKRGRILITDGHLGLLRENGDLIDSAAVSSVELKKGLTYALTSIPTLTLNGQKYKVMLSYEHSIARGLGDGEAKDRQKKDNEQLISVIRHLGGTA